MPACNERPPAGHPWHGTLVACHLTGGHAGPHAWEIGRVEVDQELLRLIEEVVRFIVEIDLNDVAVNEERREVLIQHLTGALFVRLREGGDILLSFSKPDE